MSSTSQQKTKKSEKANYGACGLRLRFVRESMGLSRPNFVKLFSEDLPETTLKNYELGYRDMAIDVPIRMEQSPKLKPYINFVMFGTSEIGVQLTPESNEPYDKYAFLRDKAS